VRVHERYLPTISAAIGQDELFDFVYQQLAGKHLHRLLPAAAQATVFHLT
jgi:hypothetical protein